MFDGVCPVVILYFSLSALLEWIHPVSYFIRESSLIRRQGIKLNQSIFVDLNAHFTALIQVIT